MRNLMRHVPSTVTVVTVHATHPDVPTPLPVGSAISSLTTVTLDPPHVSFNIKTPSRTLDAIREAGGLFCVHFLDNSDASVQVVQSFTQGNSTETLRERNETFVFAYPNNQSLHPPKIISRCVLASVTCQLVQEITVADHVVAVASVNGLSARERLTPALLYHEDHSRVMPALSCAIPILLIALNPCLAMPCIAATPSFLGKPKSETSFPESKSPWNRTKIHSADPLLFKVLQ
jgi:flavin reductase (DIM6/NTAB) family NADH-FMN oxidoreductase RutF